MSNGGPATATSVFVSELILAYDRHAEQHYQKNGKKTSEVAIVKMAVRVVNELYGHSHVTEFGPSHSRRASNNSSIRSWHARASTSW